MDTSKKSIFINFNNEAVSATIEPKKMPEKIEPRQIDEEFNKRIYFQFDIEKGNSGKVYGLRKIKSGWIQTTGEDLDTKEVQYLGKYVEKHFPNLTDSQYYPAV